MLNCPLCAKAWIHPNFYSSAGFVRANTPANEDVWGDPLRGDRDSVISKAAAAIDDAGISMPASNEEWHEMSWDEIHAMADTAAQAEGRRIDQ